MADLFKDISDGFFMSSKVHIERSLDISNKASKLLTPRETNAAMVDMKTITATLRKKSQVELEADVCTF